VYVWVVVVGRGLAE
jgi:hypothetical protein